MKLAIPKVCVVPKAVPAIVEAIRAGGGEPSNADDADGLIWTDATDPVGLKDLLKRCPARWVQLPFAGIEDFFAAGTLDRTRAWTCAKGIYGHATAEHALTLLLVASRKLHTFVGASEWRSAERESESVRRLKGSTVLLFGTGGIGTVLAQMLAPIGVRLIAVNRSGTPFRLAERTVPTSALVDVLPEADFVVIAAPLTPETQKLFGARLFERMKPAAWLVNVARGGLVDTAALLEALEKRQLAGAALDVTDPEPLPKDHPLWVMPQVIITPHVANTWLMALPELSELVRRNVAHFAAGEPLEGAVDVALGY